MRFRARTSLLMMLAAGVLASGVAESTAAARKRVVVLTFTGSRASRARRAFIRAARRRFRLLSTRRYARTARRLGVSPRSRHGIAATCGRVRCHAVIRGRVRRRRRRRYTVVVTVHDGRTGAVIGRRAATVRGRRRIARAAAAVGRSRGLRRLVARGSYRRPRRARPRPRVKPRVPPRPPRKEPRVARSPQPFKSQRDRRSDDDDDDSDEALKIKRRRKGRYDGLFDVSVSIGLSTRTCRLATPDPTTDREYGGSFFPEFSLAAELYPLVLLTRGFARNIGLGVSYTRHISISTKTGDPQAPGDVETGSQEFMIDLRLRWAFLSGRTSPVLFGLIGFGLRDFALGVNTVLPSFNYRFFNFGLGARVPLFTPLIALEALATLRPLLTVGEEALQSLGERSGGLGWSVRAGVYGKHPIGVFYFATFEFLRFGMEFAGLDATPGLDPRPDTADLGPPANAADSFVRMWVGGGFAM